MTTANWQKSSFSGSGDGNACVELASSGDQILLRESDDASVELVAGRAPLASLIQTLKAQHRDS
ncbi:DUF397 domain-containing protein [Streptomyces sp. NPDC102467]|uniref:DUF397 domain-containing protein n=1 Tax=Streptomyces sp. NPDC102467 TaxID=3366179 RepID=UPI00381B3CA4